MTDIQLTPEQLAAVDCIVDTRVRRAFITGGPGTGKTTVVRNALDELDRRGKSYLLIAPTGKAAKRLSEATSTRALARTASTIHRALNYRGERYTDCKQCMARTGAYYRELIDVDVVIVDESSMVDIELWAALVRRMRRGAALRFIGDADQLPPVGAGAPFQEFLEVLAGRDTGERDERTGQRVYLGGLQPELVKRLTRAQRFDRESWVAHAAPRILDGKMPELDDRPDFRFIEVDSASEVCATLQRMYAGEHDLPGVWSAKCVRPLYEYVAHGGPDAPVITVPTPAPILSPQRNGPAGVVAINAYADGRWNDTERPETLPLEADKISQLRVGTRVMVTRNNYHRGVVNGDTGTVADLIVEDVRRRGVTSAEVARVLVELDPDEYDEVRTVEYTAKDAIEQLSVGYAYTIHKSQGSQYPWVVVVCHSGHRRMLTRRLIYTAITRAQQGVVLIGDRAGLPLAVDNKSEVRRRSWFKPRLRERIAVERERAALREVNREIDFYGTKGGLR